MSAIYIKTSEATEFLKNILQAKLVPMLLGHPGVGKSDIIKKIAEDLNLLVIDIRLSQCDPTDLNGFPRIVGDKASYVPMDTFPIKGDKLPVRENGKKYNGWVIFLDELPSASRAVQMASYKLLLDKQIGQYDIHPAAYMIAAGNLGSSGALVNTMGTATQSRLITLQVEVSRKAWIEWAYDNDLDYRVIGFARWKTDIFAKFDPNHDDVTFSCPRTMHFLSKIVKHMPVIEPRKIAIFAGTVGEGMAREFVGFCALFGKLPDPQQMIDSPESITIPVNEPSIMHAMTTIINKHLNIKTLPSLYKLIKRLPVEFQIMCMRSLGKTDSAIIYTDEFQDFISNTGTKYT